MLDLSNEIAQCDVCQKLPIQPKIIPNKLYTMQFHPQLLDWNVVGENVWKVMQKRSLCYVLHNEKFHVTVQRASGHTLLFKQVNSVSTFTPIAELQKSHNYRKLISNVTSSLALIASSAVISSVAVPIHSFLRDSVLLLDGFFVTSVDIFGAIETQPATWQFHMLHLDHKISGRFWNGFVFRQQHVQRDAQVYKLHPDTGNITYCGVLQFFTIDFELNASNSWSQDLDHKVTPLKPEELLYTFDVTTQDLDLDEFKKLHTVTTPFAIYQHITRLKKQHQDDDMMQIAPTSQETKDVVGSVKDVLVVQNVDNGCVYILHFRGNCPQYLCLQPFNINNTPHNITIFTRDQSLLQMSNYTKTIMTQDERDMFVVCLKEHILNKTIVKDTSILQKDNPFALSWIRFLACSLPMKLRQKMDDVRIKVLHVEAAWYRFQGQIINMKHQKLCADPMIVFHGVRADDIEGATTDIASMGFNQKHARESMYGGGGIYCSPDAACALQYVKHPIGTSDMKNHMFVCLALPGRIGYQGKRDQKMKPSQNSWCEYVAPYTIYCIEANALLPIAQITFS